MPDFDRLFEVGLNGLIRELAERQQELESGMNDMHATDYIEQRQFLEAALIALRAAIRYSTRYAEKAEELSQMEADPKRKGELAEIAATCRWIMGNPPRTFREALQFFLFIHYNIHYIEYSGMGSGVRFDQIMYPFYKKDVNEGKLAREQALEFLECLWVKMQEAGIFSPPGAAAQQVGNTQFQTLNLGGVTPEGDDAFNELSLLMLDAAMVTGLPEPTFALRYHDRIAPSLVSKAIDVTRSGLGYPAFFNDKCIIPYLHNRGLSLEDARNYTIGSCVSWRIPGKNCQSASLMHTGRLSVGKCLELALSQGIDWNTGKQLGYPTPDPESFKGLEAVIDAFVKQVNFSLRKLARSTISRIACTSSLYNAHFHRPYFVVVLKEGRTVLHGLIIIRTAGEWLVLSMLLTL